MDVICLHDGRLMTTHPPERCARDEHPCCVHKPSDHPLNAAELYWHPGRRMMLRRCPHGEFHPDPDDLQVVMFPAEGSHECDGCCTPRGDQ